MKTIFDGLDRDLVVILKGRLRDLWTHSSTALEGNSLTLGETSFVLREGLTVKGKPLKDHCEVTGHAAAIELLYKFQAKKSLSVQDVFDLHREVMLGALIDIYAPVGTYKVEDNYTYLIGGGVVKFPSPENVPGLMKSWIGSFNSEGIPQDREQAVDIYSRLHVSFVKIHPFADGNGRLARLLSNIPVLKAGFPPVTIASEAREEYIKILQEYSLKSPESLELNADISTFRRFVAGQWKEAVTIFEEIKTLQCERNREIGKEDREIKVT